MPDTDNKNYTLGRGRVYFRPFLDGTTTLDPAVGRRYLGNTTALTTTQTDDNLDHFDSDSAVKEKDDTITISQSSGGSMTTDNISARNVALWFRGDPDAVVVAAAVDETMVITASRGDFYQTGASDVLPFGVKGLTTFTARTGAGAGTALVVADNFDVNMETGAFQILPDAPGITDGDEVTITFSAPVGSATVIAAAGKTIAGELFFESTSNKGPKTDWLAPYAKLTPSGDFAWKGDDWQAMTWDIELLKKGNLARQYLNRRPA